MTQLENKQLVWVRGATHAGRVEATEDGMYYFSVMNVRFWDLIKAILTFVSLSNHPILTSLVPEHETLMNSLPNKKNVRNLLLSFKCEKGASWDRSTWLSCTHFLRPCHSFELNLMTAQTLPARDRPGRKTQRGRQPRGTRAGTSCLLGPRSSEQEWSSLFSGRRCSWVTI